MAMVCPSPTHPPTSPVGLAPQMRSTERWWLQPSSCVLRALAGQLTRSRTTSERSPRAAWRRSKCPARSSSRRRSQRVPPAKCSAVSWRRPSASPRAAADPAQLRASRHPPWMPWLAVVRRHQTPCPPTATGCWPRRSGAPASGKARCTLCSRHSPRGQGGDGSGPPSACETSVQPLRTSPRPQVHVWRRGHPGHPAGQRCHG